MKPNFQKMLKPGTRIVAHDFGIEGWQPDKMLKLPGYELKPGGAQTPAHTLLVAHRQIILKSYSLESISCSVRLEEDHAKISYSVLPNQVKIIRRMVDKR
jgi:hypothetical protein